MHHVTADGATKANATKARAPAIVCTEADLTGALHHPWTNVSFSIVARGVAVGVGGVIARCMHCDQIGVVRELGM